MSTVNKGFFLNEKYIVETLLWPTYSFNNYLGIF